MVKQTTAQVVEDFIKVHGDTYDYSLVEYVKSSEKVIIICKEHGEFTQTPNGHKSGKGCRLCNGGSQLNNKEYIKRATKVHNGLYSYDRTEYKSMKDTVVVTCPLHGDFEILAEVHVARGRGCKKCSNRHRMSEEEFINEARITHNNMYKYDKVKYISSESHVSIKCKIHGYFEQTPYKHLSGQGCPACNHGGFASNKAGTLYYLKINGGEAYKIGITNRTVELRFTFEELKLIEVLKTWDYQNGKECYMQEQQILKQYKKHKYTGPPLLLSGNTELFTTDILGLDSASKKGNNE